MPTVILVDADSLAELSGPEVEQRLGSISNGDEVKAYVRQVKSFLVGVDALAAQVAEDAEGVSPSSSSPARPTRKRVRRKVRIANQAPYHLALVAWVEAHLDHPIPTRAEKDALQAEHNLTDRQLHNWFSNARRRLVPRLRKLQQEQQAADALLQQLEQE